MTPAEIYGIMITVKYCAEALLDPAPYRVAQSHAFDIMGATMPAARSSGGEDGVLWLPRTTY
ncbi:hypothetical protein BKP54_16970 [Ensifer sp. 1H6]|nr:hypothetical protein BKP54_16970 [Ensifer sp. 1H6]